jgi:hypothetical protein
LPFFFGCGEAAVGDDDGGVLPLRAVLDSVDNVGDMLLAG